MFLTISAWLFKLKSFRILEFFSILTSPELCAFKMHQLRNNLQTVIQSENLEAAVLFKDLFGGEML